MDNERCEYSLLALPAHLRNSGDWPRLHRLLTSFRFMSQKTTMFGPQSLIDDYATVGERYLLEVESALRLAAQTTDRFPSQLAGQLIGRLKGHDRKLKELVREAERWSGGTLWNGRMLWLRPLNRSLTTPGGALRRTLRGHTDCVFALAISPDGRHAITGAGTITSGTTKIPDHTIRVWDLETGTQIRVIHGHEQNVNAVALAPDGTRILSASKDSSIVVWDFATGAKVSTLLGHEGSVTCLKVLSDGEHAISGSEDGTANLWDIATGRIIRTFAGHSNHVTALTLTTDEAHLVTASADKTIKIWNLGNGQPERTLRGHTETIWSVALLPGGTRLVSSAGFIYGKLSDTTLKVWDLATGQELRTLSGHSSAVTSVAVSVDGKHILSASADKTIRKWDLKTGKEIWSLEAHGNIINALAISADSSTLVSASSDLLVKIWDLQRIEPRKPDSNHTRAVETITVTPDGKHAVTTGRDAAVKVWRFKPWGLKYTLSNLSVRDLIVTPDSKSMITIDIDATLTFWDLSTGRRRFAIPGSSGTRLFPRGRKLALTPDGLRVVAVAGGNSVKLWDMRRFGVQIASYTGTGGEITCVCLSPDGSYAILGSDDQTTRIWYLNSGTSSLLQRSAIPELQGPRTELERLNPVDKERVMAVDIAPTGDRAVSVLSGNVAEIWNLADLQREYVLSAHRNWISGAYFTPDGSTLVTSSRDHTANVWDLRTGALARTFNGHEDSVEALSLTSDGRLAVTVSDTDCRLVVWDVASGLGVAAFTTDVPLTSCATCPDKQTILAGDQLGGLHLLRLEGANL